MTVILSKCIYDLVQAARQYYKKTAKILKKLCLIGGSFDQCLYVKKSEKGIVYVVLYVDDNLMIDIEAIDEAITALQDNGLVLKLMEGLQDSLSCEAKFSKDKKRTWLGWPYIIKDLSKKFGDHVTNI